MQEVRVPIRPGGMLSDVVENQLIGYRHDEVQNLKQNKIGEWENVKGYITAVTSLTNIKAAIEVSDDLSGDRFLLVQDGTALRRIDYDISNSPNTGYENESKGIIQMPSGVTVGADDTLRFFVHNGIVRITGASEPVWYGYIKRKMFYTGFEEESGYDFETASHVNNFTASDCSISQSSAAAKHGSNSMLLTTSADGGYAYYTLTAKPKGKYRLYMWVRKATEAASEDFVIKVGTTAGEDDIAYHQAVPFNTATWKQVLFEFDVPDSDNSTETIYISIFPESTGNGDTVYVDDWKLHASEPQLEIANWYIEKAALTKDAHRPSILLARPTGEDGSTNYDSYVKYVLIYDGGQYALVDNLNNLDSSAFVPHYKILTNDPAPGAKLQLRIPGSSLTTPSSLPNIRVTGILVVIASNVYPISEDDATTSWQVVHALDFREHPATVKYTRDKTWYESATPKRLFLRYDSKGADYHSEWEDGFIQVGAMVRIGDFYSKVTAVSITGAGNEDYVDFEDDIYPDLVTPDVDTAKDNLRFEVDLIYDYDSSNGFDIDIGVEFLSGTEVGEYTDVPYATTDNTPDYTRHQVIENRGFCLSNEDDEQDTIRYTPLAQFDNFLAANIIQTPVGDVDQNIGLIERDGRFVALKRHSISQGQFTAASYYHDKSGKKHGLYPDNGYIVVNDVLYFMDKDDVYTFNGVTIEPFLTNKQIRKYYADNVTSNSFFAWKPLEKELWMVLTDKSSTMNILVYDYERGDFYIRKIASVVGKAAFNTFDQRLLMAEGGNIRDFDHSQSTYVESVECYFQTGLIDMKTPEYRKIIRKILARTKAAVNLTITASDVNESSSYSEAKTPDATNVDLLRYSPRYLFREAYIKASFATSKAPGIKIKSLDAIIGRWK